MKILKRIIAAIIFVPALLLSLPAYLYYLLQIKWCYKAWRIEKLWGNWSTIPFLWAHLWLCCGGDRIKQII